MKGLVIMLHVVHALMLRETRTRYGTNRVGYLWALGGPLSLIGIFAIMGHLSGRQGPVGMDLVSFLTTGFLTFMMFRGTASRGISAIDANRGLLFYPQVRPLDLVIARALLEMITLVVVFAVIMGVNAFWRQSFEVDDLLTFLYGFGVAWGLGASLGLVICGLSVFSQNVERVETLLLRPLFWVSGLFFTANGLPKQVRDIMLYNPLLHAVELVRDGWFRSYTAWYADGYYPLWFIAVLAFIGLALERVTRGRRMEAT